MSEKVNFEDSLTRLETITGKLEGGELTLDESLKLFEEGIRLSRFCENKLTSIEQKIEILNSNDIDCALKQLDELNSDAKEKGRVVKKKKSTKKTEETEKKEDGDGNYLF